MKNYSATKKLFKSTFHTILNKEKSYALAEAAFPAYAHKNPLIDYLFWRRVEITYEYILKQKPKIVVDFGCGSGLLSYLLAKENIEVIAVDVEMGPLKKIKEYITFPPNIKFVDASTEPMPIVAADYIIALDVLEHVKDLDEQIMKFKNYLNSSGKIIVSGPTENILYKIGRKLAGTDFSGDYHVSDIEIIKKRFINFGEVRTIKKLFPLIKFFEVFEAKIK